MQIDGRRKFVGARPTFVAATLLVVGGATTLKAIAAPCPAQPTVCINFDGLDWRTDRFSPDTVEILPTFAGQTDVLHMQLGPNGIHTARPSSHAGRFYDTQGITADTHLQSGSAFISGLAYISSDMEAAQTSTLVNGHDTGNFVRIGLWGVTSSGSTSAAVLVPDPIAPSPAGVTGYPIMMFTNANAAGHIQIFDDITGNYISVNAPINYDGWNRFEVRFIENTYVFLVNGTIVHTLTGRSANSGADKLSAVILNSSNNNTSTYEVYWDDILRGAVRPGGPITDDITGDVTITGGSTPVLEDITIPGSLATDQGSVLTVDGATLEVQGGILKGRDTSLSIDNGGVVRSESGVIGLGGASTATITGNGSVWETSGDITVGNSQAASPGSGVMTVSDNAVVSAGSGAGSIVLGKAEQGSLRSSIANSTNGTLNIGSGGTPGVLNVAEVTSGGGDATINFNHSQDAYYFSTDGASTGTGVLISGTTSVRQMGAGTTILTRDNTYTGPTIVDAGTLRVDGHQGSSPVMVNGGRLSGNGTVGATTVRSGGAIAPGASIGTMTVSGAYVQDSGAVYQAEVDPDSTQSDQIAVTGTATLASGAVLEVSKINNSPYRLGTRYTVLTTTGGLTGTFALTGDLNLSAFTALTGVYDANNAYLEVLQSTDLDSVAETSNQRATAAGLQSLGLSSPLFVAVLASPDEPSARAAFDNLSGELHASLKSVLLDQSGIARAAALARLRQVACPGDTNTAGTQALQQDQQDQKGACSADRRGAWARVVGYSGHTDGNSNVSRLNQTVSGVLVGADARLANSWTVGVLGGYAKGDFDQGSSGSGSSDNYSLGVYGSTSRSNVNLRIGAAYTWHSVETRRTVSLVQETLRSKQDAKSYQFFGEVGYSIPAGTVSVEPFAGLAYAKLRTDSFTERGGTAALSGRSASDDVTFSSLGVRASSKPFSMGNAIATVDGTLAWRHAFDGSSPSRTLSFAGGTPYTVAGAPIADDAALVELGLTAQLRANLKLGVFYTAQLGGGATYQGARLNLGWTF